MAPLCLVPALVLLFFYVSTFRSMCAVPNMAVFCSSLTSRFPGMSLTHFLNDLEMVPVTPVITGITLVFTFHLLLLLLLLLLSLSSLLYVIHATFCVFSLCITYLVRLGSWFIVF